MWSLWIGLALGSAGSRTCVFRGISMEIRWKEDGTVKVLDRGRLLVSADAGKFVGTTTASCLPEGVKFLTDTHEVPGKLTLETAKIGLSSVLDTLDPARLKAAAAPRPRPRARPRPRPQPAAAPPRQDPAERSVKECVQTTVYAAYDDGWALRSIVVDTIDAYDRRNYVVSLVAGNEYRFVGCGESNLANVDLILYDQEGVPVSRDETSSRQPQMSFRPAKTGQYHVFVMNPSGYDAAISMGVVYR